MNSAARRQAQVAASALQVALVLFLSVALLLVSAFFTYHLVLILSGMTSYESYKWTMLYKVRALEQEAEERGRTRVGNMTTAEPDKAPAWSATGLWTVLRGRRKVQGMPANPYDKGWLRNFQDALGPPAWASQLSDTSSSEVKRD